MGAPIEVRVRGVALGFLLVTVMACGGCDPIGTVDQTDPALPPVEAGN